MTDYTPTTEEVRFAMAGLRMSADRFVTRESFDRWLAAHDAEVRAAVVAEEPEWEYGVRRRHGVDEYPDEHTARWWIGRKGQDGERQWLLRRRPGSAPREWERVPVKQEGADDA